MGQPSIQIQFQTAAKESISLLSKGNLGNHPADENGAGAHIITGVDEIPKEITAANQGYLQRALIGSDNRPQKVFAYVLTADGEMGEALQYFSTQNVDYLCPPPEGEEADVTALIDWVKKQREDQRIYKAVVANQAADCEGVINFTISGHPGWGSRLYTAAQYVSRIAGILVGGAVKGSCTYKPLLGGGRLYPTGKQGGGGCGRGQRGIDFAPRRPQGQAGQGSQQPDHHRRGQRRDAEKNQDCGNQRPYYLRPASCGGGSLHRQVQQRLFGQVDLAFLISAYLQEMEEAGYLKAGTSFAAIDMDAQRAYLKKQGVNVDGMTEQQIKEADTDTFVFVLVKCRPLDAIEDVVICVDMRREGAEV